MGRVGDFRVSATILCGLRLKTSLRTRIDLVMQHLILYLLFWNFENLYHHNQGSEKYHSPTSKLVDGNYSVPRVRYSIQSTVSAVNYRVFPMVKVN